MNIENWTLNWRTVHVRLIRNPEDSLLPIMYGPVWIDQVDDIGIVLVGSNMEREEILVKTHNVRPG